MNSGFLASLASVVVASNRVSVATAERSLAAPIMPSTIDVFSRRHRVRALLRAFAIPALAALVFMGFDAQTAEATQIRTAFRNASPRIRQREAQIRNGSQVRLTVELYEGKKKQGVPNQLISFYVVINGKKMAVGKAWTDSRGYATVVTPPIWVSGLTGPKPPRYINVAWYPVFANKPPYLRAQNNALGTGFRVLP